MSGGFWHVFKIVSLSTLAFVLIFGTGAYVWAQGYTDRIPPNVSVANISYSSLTPEQARASLQARIDEVITGGVEITMNGELYQMPLATLVGTDLQEYIDYDLDAALEAAMSAHRENKLENVISMLLSLKDPQNIMVDVEIHYDTIKELLLNQFPEAETLSSSASYTITSTSEGWDVHIEEGTSGTEFQWEDFFEELETDLLHLNGSSVTLELKDQEPRVASYEAAAQIEDVVVLLDASPYVFVFEDENDTWELNANKLAEMILPGEDVMPVIDEELFLAWFEEEISTDINQESTDARLNIENGRVTDFVASQQGRAVNQEDALEQFNSRIASLDNSNVMLLVETEEPSVTTADVNDLGITEILGVGTSSYAGSPSNRRTNIQNGVDLLNGRLIAPGETFSLIEALAPFTYENGYLPELVIKGDKIEPEMGGGLCQIGSTTFRATMNAGLEVTERRNHSLVVSYYNDPTNGLPGTDATIYEPAPDYKFTNDTEHYVLFQAENLTATSELRFTFWGTSDGRQGSYTAPVVHRWIPVGPTQYIETLDLAPGTEECQYEHIGADASFTYTVVRPTGEIDETLFESHYRPLSRICLVGVEALSSEEDEETAEEETSESTNEEEATEEEETTTEEATETAEEETTEETTETETE